MQGLCGQCGKPFSPFCEQLFPCSLHQGQCFSCKPCKSGKPQPTPQLATCNICHRRTSIHELYYDYQCDFYICHFDFLKLDMTKEQTVLPCGDIEMTEGVIVYMSGYCALCGRKLINYSKNGLGICFPCQRKGLSILKQSAQKKQFAKQDFVKESCEMLEPERIPQQPKETHNETIKLKNQLLLLNQMLKVSEYTRLQIKGAICHSERDRECLICMQAFNLAAKKPMMVCMQQHLVCQKCIQDQPTLQHCPLCREQIIRSKIFVSRERIKTIQLQYIISQKYETKLQKCLQMEMSQVIQKEDNVQTNLNGQIQVKMVQIQAIQKKKGDAVQAGKKPMKGPVTRRVNQRAGDIRSPDIRSSNSKKRGRPASIPNSGCKKQKH